MNNNFADNAAQRGDQLVALLKAGLAGNDSVLEVRHQGLLIGIEMKQNCQALVALALEQGLLINVTAERVIRLLPPLTIDSDHTIELAELLIPCINKFSQSN